MSERRGGGGLGMGVWLVFGFLAIVRCSLFVLVCCFCFPSLLFWLSSSSLQLLLLLLLLQLLLLWIFFEKSYVLNVVVVVAANTVAVEAISQKVLRSNLLYPHSKNAKKN